MGKVKVLTAREAADLIKDGATVTMSGFVANGIAEALNAAAEERFLETGHPKDLTLFYVAGTGNKDGSHADHYAHEGMVKRVIGGHFNFVPQICEMLYANKIEGYNIPQGAISSMLRDSAGHKIGTFTPVGIGTFADPRLGGGRLNEKTTEDIVKVIEIEGEEQLFYPRIGLDVAFIRGTYADELGNITLEKEMAPLDCTAQAMGWFITTAAPLLFRLKRLLRPDSSTLSLLRFLVSMWMLLLYVLQRIRISSRVLIVHMTLLMPEIHRLRWKVLNRRNLMPRRSSAVVRRWN